MSYNQKPNFRIGDNPLETVKNLVPCSSKSDLGPSRQLRTQPKHIPERRPTSWHLTPEKQNFTREWWTLSTRTGTGLGIFRGT